MKILERIVLFSILIAFTACTKYPEIPKYSIHKEDKIGYIIEESGDVFHAHMGTTIFNNLEKSYSYNWKLENNIDLLLKENVKRELINLKEKGIVFSDIFNLIVAKSGKWTVVNNEKYQKLRKDLGLKAILVFYQTDTYIETGRMPLLMKKSGLASHNFLGMKRYFAVSAYDCDLYLLNPLAVVKQEDPDKFTMIYDSVYSSVQDSSGFENPKDIDNLTKNELIKVREEILDLLDSLTLDIETLLIE